MFDFFFQSFDKLVLSGALFYYLFISFNEPCFQSSDCLSSTKNDLRLALESLCLSSIDLLWHSAYFFDNHQPDWSGYIRSVTTKTYSEKPHVALLSIVYLSASNSTVLNSMLQYIL